MNRLFAIGNRRARQRIRVAGCALGLLVSVFYLSGCAMLSMRREPPRPGRTKLSSPMVIVPAQNIGNYLVIEAKWDRSGPYRFIIDTGSSVTLVTPAFVKRYGSRAETTPAAPRVRVTSAEGKTVELPSGTVQEFSLGEARFSNVPVLVYDCAPLSAHLGVRIDGILGFPLFRETLLTLDYPNGRVLLQPRGLDTLLPGTTIEFEDKRKTPLIPVKLGDRTFVALIDSGSDAPLSLNPVGLEPKFISGPRPGATIGTLTGDRAEQVGRLAEPLALGDYVLTDPIVDLTEALSSIGGALLKNFTVTFDQEHGRVTFYRQSREPIVAGPRRSAGLSFNKTPAYWRVAGVVPGSSAATSNIQRGDLVIRINGESVERWDLTRYEEFVASTSAITFTFLQGTQETDLQCAVFDLVP